MARYTIPIWNRNQADEDALGAAHAPIWRRMIDVAAPADLRQSTVLDYGCNQGGFLRLLKCHRPIDYKVGDQAAVLGKTFDLAFSHEVIYLLPDPAAHARDIKAALRPGGAYVAAMGCHTDSGLWPRWRTLIAESSSIPIYDHSLEDVSKAFAESGFNVSVRPLALDAFMPFTSGSAYFPKVMDQLRYYSIDKVLFRFVRVP
jgi:SAM-dependent methyltransferase